MGTGGEPDNIYVYKMSNCIHKQGLWITITHFAWSASMNAQIQLEGHMTDVSKVWWKIRDVNKFEWTSTNADRPIKLKPTQMGKQMVGKDKTYYFCFK